MSKVDTYYEILGLNTASSISEIRRSYRLKAKLWHPDVNKDPGAHEKFILLREAYEYLTDLRSGRVIVSQEPYVWTEERKQEARKRAETYAGMNYREFRKSDYSRGGEALEVAADHINLVAAAGVSITIIYLLTRNLGLVGFVISLLPSFVIIYVSYYNLSGGIDIRKFGKSVFVILTNRIVHGIFLFLLNVYIFLSIGYHTLIPLYGLFAMYVLAMIAGLFLALTVPRFKNAFNLRFFPLCLGPSCIGAFLSLNYFLSSNPHTESYKFMERRDAAVIVLENDTYGAYEGIRMFFNADVLGGKEHITYTFEDGLFGLGVMKDYKLD